jgi:hypothetical protein
MRRSEGAEPAVARAIERLREEAAAYFGRPLSRVIRRQEQRRPGSHVVWLDAWIGNERCGLVLKAPVLAGRDDRHAAKQRRRLSTEFESSRALAAALGDEARAGVVEMVCFFDDLPALVMREAPGASVTRLISRAARSLALGAPVAQLESACAAAGGLLRAVHGATLRPEERLSIDPMIDYIDVRLRALVDRGVAAVSERWRRDVLAALTRMSDEATHDDLRVATVHGDFCPGNVIYAPGRAVLIDLSQVQAGSVLYDLTRFHHQLQLVGANPVFRRDVIARLQRALLAGYGAPIDPEGPLFRLFTIQHSVCHWLGRVKRSDTPFRDRLFDGRATRFHRETLARLLA